MSVQSVLIAFKCQSCKYEEPIGVDPRAGVILEGAITIVCPQCGAISRFDNVRAILPVRFLPQGRPQ